MFEAGSLSTPFTIQSISKPFTFGMVIEELGHETVWQHVGIEPSGDAFNSIELEDGTWESARIRRAWTSTETAAAAWRRAPSSRIDWDYTYLTV